MTVRAYIGTSGFSYPHWRGDFYPSGVPQQRWLEFYAERFDTVELNNTFYAMPRGEQCSAWARCIASATISSAGTLTATPVRSGGTSKAGERRRTAASALPHSAIYSRPCPEQTT